MLAPSPRLRFQLIAATLARVVMNTAHRMIYPFLPAFSRGLGVSPESLTLVLSVSRGLGITSPLFGAIPDRFGRRLAMLIGMAIFCAALALAGVFPSYLTFFIAIILIVVTKFIFDPALQAYLGDRVPYARRGLVIAFTEIGWSGATLVGIPLVGFLIARGSWRAPFLPLAGLGVISGLLLWLLIPADPPGLTHASAHRPNRWAAVWRSPVVLAAMCLGLISSAANESLNAVYGRWMEQSFHLDAGTLGLTTVAIGLAELAGEGLVMGLADRLGKRRAIALGLAASSAAYLALPLLASNLTFALAALFFVYITFEFTIVASIPLMTELVPEARSTTLSANVAFHSAGRAVGVLLGGWLFPFGFVWNGVAATTLNLIALGVLILFVREQK